MILRAQFRHPRPRFQKDQVTGMSLMGGHNARGDNVIYITAHLGSISEKTDI
jgi:hypothetical protein